VSQDNPVTPNVTASTSNPSVAWLERMQALSGIEIVRKRTIERLYGSSRRLADRCGCQNESRFSSAKEEAKLWCVVVPQEDAGRVTAQSSCTLLKTGWCVWQPGDLGFAWAEILEVDDIGSVFGQESALAQPMSKPLEEWEKLGRMGITFRMNTLVHGDLDETLRRCRVEIVQDILRRNPKFSHVNLTLSQNKQQFADVDFERPFAAAGLTVDRLRERMIPSWQSGDMAIRRFTTYTMTRKDTR
jgi:hypothetical protein